jgi:hypothetical protein
MNNNLHRDGRNLKLNCAGRKDFVQSAFHEKDPAGGGVWCGSGGEFTGGWTTGLLLVENGMTLQGVTLLHTD